MNKLEKGKVVEKLKGLFSDFDSFYITNLCGLSVEQINSIRKRCYKEGVRYVVAKNSLFSLALDGFSKFFDYALKDFFSGFSGVFFLSSDKARFPAKIINEIRSSHLSVSGISLKCAFVNGDIYVGNDSLKILSKIKSRNEVLGDIVLSLKGVLGCSIQAILDSKKKEF